MFISILLTLSILAGQLIKFPLFGIQGPTLLDFLITLGCVVGLYKLKFRLKKIPPSFSFAFVFILVATISLIFTPLHLRLGEYFVSFSYTVRLFLYFLFSWIIYSGGFLNLKKSIDKILLISGVGLAILGLLQFLIFPNLEFLANSGWDPHYFRTVSTFLDPNFAGAYFVLTLLLLSSLRGKMYQTVRPDKTISHIRLSQPLRGFAMTLVYIALLTTFSRSSYLMFLTSGLVYGILKKSKFIAISSIVLFLGLLLGLQVYLQLVANPRGIDRTQSASYRLDTWQEGLSLFQKSPILGVGFNSYKYAIREYHLADFQFLQSRGSSSNDSSFLYILSTTGIVGFITYLLFLISLVKSKIKSDLILIAAIVGLIPHCLFANSLFYPFIFIWILLRFVDIKD